MDTGEALFDAILANPDDNTVRLVYADYLEETDRADEANLIRCEINGYKGPYVSPCGRLPEWNNCPCEDCAAYKLKSANDRREDWIGTESWSREIKRKILNSMVVKYGVDARWDRGMIQVIGFYDTHDFYDEIQNDNTVLVRHPIEEVCFNNLAVHGIYGPSDARTRINVSDKEYRDSGWPASVLKASYKSWPEDWGVRGRITRVRRVKELASYACLKLIREKREALRAVCV